MKEILRTSKVEVAQHYLLGCTYREIEQYTGVSHGSIANIVQELENGKLHIPGTPFDQVNDLRQLSLDLKKKGLSTSQAVLGVAFFDRTHDLGVSSERLDQWAELVSKFSTPDFPTGNFLGVALKLHQLEKNEGKSFETVAEEYEIATESLEKIKKETASLEEKRAALSQEITSTSSHLEKLDKSRAKLESDVEMLLSRAKELKSRIDENMLERAALNKDVKELKQQKVKLSSQVDGKEESLIRLNNIGFQDEDLLRLSAILERITRDANAGQKEVKERFFRALATFKAITELETSQGVEMAALEDLTREKSVLMGEIAGLQSTRDILSGQVGEITSGVLKQITDEGSKTVSELQRQTKDIRGQLDELFGQAIRVAGVLGEMQAMVKQGDESGKSLENFIKEARGAGGKS